MAVPTGSGTEVIKAAHFDDVDATQTLIFGAQHHIYTVLSTICFCVSVGAAADIAVLGILGNGSHDGGTAHFMKICQFNLAANETFVWNDKFSFFGFETAAFTEPLDSLAEQTGLATQNSSVPQKYQYQCTDADVHYDVHVSFIDQDWS
jgi:hypothetical protein